MKRKILFIVNSLCFGGAEKHVVTLLNHLSPQDSTLSLAFLKDDTTLLPQIDRTKVPEILQLQTTRKLDWGAISKLANHIDDSEIDLIVCTNLYPLLYGWLARMKSRRRPRLVEVFHTTLLATTAEKIKMRLFQLLFRTADMLVYVCENQRTYWSAKGLRAKAEQVIHNGIDVEHFRDRYDAETKAALRRRHDFAEEDHVVGICASMRPEKAHGDLLAAIAQLKAEGIRVKALLIGDGIERPRIEQQIAALGIGDDVRITGFQEDVRPLIAICDIVAITSHHIETFSIAALEAMALGKPMVMTEIGGAAEQVTPGVNGYLYPAGDIAALSQALRNSMQPGTCMTLGGNARAIVESRFSLPTMVRAFEKLFSSMTPDNKKQVYPSLAP